MKYQGNLPNLKVDGKIVHAKIGQATSDERGKLTGGKVGDQTGKEVSISNWSYSKKSGAYNHWTVVGRAKDKDKRQKIADKMKAICKNNNVGYNQKPKGGRKALYEKLKAIKWDVSKLGKVDTSCTPVVQACIGSVGITIAQGSDAAHLEQRLKSTGKFYLYHNSKYLTTDANLKVGDVLNSGRHSALVVEERKVTKTTKNMKKGDSRKAEVKKWQKYVNWFYGKDVLKVDGVFGSNTEKYTKKVKAKLFGKTVNGVVGTKTIELARKWDNESNI